MTLFSRQLLPENAILEQISGNSLGQPGVVHVRLYMLVIQNDDPGPTLENLVRLLSMSLANRCPHSTKKLLIARRLANSCAVTRHVTS